MGDTSTRIRTYPVLQIQVLLTYANAKSWHSIKLSASGQLHSIGSSQICLAYSVRWCDALVTIVSDRFVERKERSTWPTSSCSPPTFDVRVQRSLPTHMCQFMFEGPEPPHQILPLLCLKDVGSAVSRLECVDRGEHRFPL
jgi:hypothetical protein